MRAHGSHIEQYKQQYISMKVMIILSICLGSTLPSIAQTPKENSVRHNQLINEADAAVDAGEYTKAVPLYDSALKLVDRDLGPYFDATLAALRAGREDQANEFLLKGVEHGFVPSVYQDSIYTAFLASNASKPFRDQQTEATKKFAAHADSAMIDQLERLYTTDQDNREATPSNLRNDSLIFEELITLSENKGFPTARTVGSSSGTPWLLLWHHRGPEYADSPQWKRIMPYFEKAIDTGDLDPAFLCMFEDFKNGEKGIPMKYGSLIGYYRNAREKLYLADRTQVNANRASVGWGTIEDFAAQVGIDLSSVRFAEP